jgi:hypothetical protein
MGYINYLFEYLENGGSPDKCMTFEEYLAGLPSDEARQQAIKEYEDAFKPKGDFQHFMAEVRSIPKETIRNYLNGSGGTPKSDQKLASSKRQPV